MTTQQLISAIFLGLSLVLLAVFPLPQIAFTTVAAAILFGFLIWIDRQKHGDLADIESQIKLLKDKIEVIQIQKGFGR